MRRKERRLLTTSKTETSRQHVRSGRLTSTTSFSTTAHTTLLSTDLPAIKTHVDWLIPVTCLSRQPGASMVVWWGCYINTNFNKSSLCWLVQIISTAEITLGSPPKTEFTITFLVSKMSGFCVELRYFVLTVCCQVRKLNNSILIFLSVFCTDKTFQSRD